LDIKNISANVEANRGIGRIQGSWQGITSQRPEQLRSLKKVSTIESIGSSNRIEGNNLSDAAWKN